MMENANLAVFVYTKDFSDEDADERIDAGIDGLAQYFPIDKTEDIWRKWVKHILWNCVGDCIGVTRKVEATWYAESVCAIPDCFIGCRKKFIKWWKSE